VARVLNHLPVRYRVAVWIAGLVACAGTGAWLVTITRVPLQWQSGAAIGLVLGGLVVASFLRAFERSAPPGGDAAHRIA
jgi:hypothetical protein